MNLFNYNKSKNMIRLLGVFLAMGFVQPVWAAGPPAPSAFSNPLAIVLVVLMLLLLIVIGILANILIGTADVKLKKRKQQKAAVPIAAVLITLLLLSSSSLFAQTGAAPADAAATTTAGQTIGGMTASTFYVMATVIFLELFIIIALLINIKFLLKAEKDKLVAETQPVSEEVKKNQLSWWDKFNSFRPSSQEADLDLGHDYDGIRELNNRLPKWWLYGFYLTIIVGCIYLYRFHIAHTGPSSKQEFETSVANAEIKVKEYLKMKGENVDENSITFLSAKEDLEAGKAIFIKDGFCATCHGKDGSGTINGVPGVGPNLTDDYWIHGGSIKNIFTTIKYGVSGKGMQEWESKLSPKELAQVASYVKSLKGSNPPNPKAPDGPLYKEEATPAAPAIDSAKGKDGKMAMN
jgi:cytochrome c oxidase cbb3-type subunit 3